MLYGGFLIAAVLGGFVGALVVGLSAASGSAAQENPAVATTQMLEIMGAVIVPAGVAMGYFAIRLGFLLVPVTVAEHKMGLWRSWELTKGNFWRSFTVIFITGLPILIFSIVSIAITMGPTYFAMFQHLGDPQALAAQMRQLQATMQSQWHYMPYMWALGAIVAPFSYGLWIAPAVFAYRALVPEDGGTGAPE